MPDLSEPLGWMLDLLALLALTLLALLVASLIILIVVGIPLGIYEDRKKKRAAEHDD